MNDEKKQILIEKDLFSIPTSLDEKPHLIGSRCEVCNQVTFPKMEVCPRCLRRGTMREKLLKGRGKLDTFTIVNAALPGFKAPSIQAYIRLDEGPLIWSLITDVEPNEKFLKSGMDMELVIRKIREDDQGNEIISYLFRPIKE